MLTGLGFGDGVVSRGVRPKAKTKYRDDPPLALSHVVQWTLPVATTEVPPAVRVRSVRATSPAAQMRK